jgi:hypothetical protein
LRVVRAEADDEIIYDIISRRINGILHVIFITDNTVQGNDINRKKGYSVDDTCNVYRWTGDPAYSRLICNHRAIMSIASNEEEIYIRIIELAEAKIIGPP